VVKRRGKSITGHHHGLYRAAPQPLEHASASSSLFNLSAPLTKPRQAPPSDLYFDLWAAQLAHAKKTMDQMQFDVKRMLLQFPMRITATSIRIFFGLLLLGAIGAYAAEPPKGFRSLQWGGTPSGGMRPVGPAGGELALYVPASGTSLPPLFGIPVADESYSFSKGKFFSGSAWLDGQENFEKMKAALIKDYGTPSFVNEKLYVWKWKWPGSRIEVDLFFQPKDTRTTVTFLNDAISEAVSPPSK
jgi:hypothetical protein